MYALRRWFSKRIGYPLLIFGRGARDRKMRAFIDEKLALARRPREELAARQLELLKPLLVHAGRNVPFYRRRFAEAGFDPAKVTSLDDLKRIPPLTKDDLRTQLDELITEGFDRSKLIHRATGGSTGVPVKLYTDEEAFAHWEASEVVADEMSGWRPGEPIALLWGANFEVSVSQNVMGRLRTLARNQLILNTFKLDEAILAGFHRQLTRFRPALLVGYTSALMAMADWFERSGTAPAYPTLSIINAAETLQAWQRERIEHVYGAPVFDRYGARDGGPMAMECEAHNGLHVNVVDLVVEANGGEPGEPQELLITNLNAYGMPLIRYEIGDLAVFSDRVCTCGRTTPLFERLVGRITDVIHLADGRLVPGELFPHLLKDYPIVEFQVVQHADRSLTIRAVQDRGYTPEHEAHIRRIVADHAGALPVRFEYVERIDRTRTGKLRPVVSEIQPGTGAVPEPRNLSCQGGVT
jgi:phenylacetate-CoA ligase